MTISIAVSGKGGTGKTTIAALTTLNLIRANKTPVLVVDADPNATFHEMFNIQEPITIGNLREELTKGKIQVPEGIAKEEFLTLKMEEQVVEYSGFDLVTMGRQEGPGCYCFLNMILRRYLDRIGERYKYVILDNEAGMEHLSRRTTRDIDYLFLVAEPTEVSLRSIIRIATLAKSLELKIKHIYAIINKFDEISNSSLKIFDDAALEIIGAIPQDSELSDFSKQGTGIDKIGSDNKAFLAVNNILEKLAII